MSPQHRELANVARDYCEMVETVEYIDEQWIELVAALLPRLHAAVSALGTVGLVSKRHTRVDLDARFEFYSKLRSLLGEKDSYWLEFDVAEDGQSKSGSLADDLTDIYCELKEGLNLMEGEPSQALEGLRVGYHLHWGRHLIDAQRHLYELRSSYQIDL
ncbi:DUF5063 domain-containing protein [endosymbiont of Riftia pachyptila]|uniref:DUF5063 domain-containing protein n=1 Tax=endosymbiont of Riftia pachyptila (vent Ph05) TaxID=1048808 RepID=G2DDH5_9GAMM|nr:DUF5063 domain-containing protein [endosymbiont of Riftia pachyptila]EGV51319.1 hypothetical protein Rifp1Sym_bn00110 [endosymbiont of Riftia pachyptila (vent Ph05)]